MLHIWSPNLQILHGEPGTKLDAMAQSSRPAGSTVLQGNEDQLSGCVTSKLLAPKMTVSKSIEHSDRIVECIRELCNGDEALLACRDRVDALPHCGISIVLTGRDPLHQFLAKVSTMPQQQNEGMK